MKKKTRLYDRHGALTKDGDAAQQVARNLHKMLDKLAKRGYDYIDIERLVVKEVEYQMTWIKLKARTK